MKSNTDVSEASRNRFKRSLLAVSIMALSVPTFAQTAAQDENLEEVVVTGMKNSIATAQDLKRNADTVIDVITASDIGALPDKSVTEALQRVAGVTIERFASSDDPNHYADEGTGVLVRGLDRVRSEINGRDAFSANPWGGLNYEDIPPELLGSVEVVKNQTADLIAGGVAGTVNLVTRKPFDSEGRVLGASLKANYGDFREELTPSVSALYSDRWETSAGEFGFLISASNSQLKSRGDRIGVANFYSRGDAAGLDGGALNGQEAGTVLYMPGQASIGMAENDRERTGFASSLQWQNTDETVVATLEYLRSEAVLLWRENIVGQQAQGFSLGDMIATNLDPSLGLKDSAVFDDQGFFVSGATINNPLLLSTRWNDTENIVEDASFHLTLRPTDKLTLDFDYQRVDSTSAVDNYGVNSRSLASESYLDLSGTYPKIEYRNPSLGTPNPGDYSNNYILRSVMEQNSFNEAASDSYQLEGKYEFDDSWITSVKAGGYFSDKDLTVRDTEYSNWGAVACGWWGCGDTVNQAVDDIWGTVPAAVKPEGVAIDALRESIANYSNASHLLEAVSFDNFFRGGGQLVGQDTFYFPKLSKVKDLPNFIRQLQQEGLTCTPINGCITAQADKDGRIEEGSPYAPHQVSTVNEERMEAYIRADFAFDDLAVPVKGNLGARYVSYQLESTGFAMFPDTPNTQNPEWYEAASPGILDFANGAASDESTVVGKKFTTVLPSFNLAASLQDDLIARFGYSKGLYFPNLVDVRNNKVMSLSKVDILEDPTQPQSDTNKAIGIESVAVTGQSRNPNLQPEESDNFDVTLEWYFSKTNSIAASLFYKEIDQLFRERYFGEYVTNNGQTRPVSFAGPTNEGSGSLQGLELSYTQFYDMLPGAWSGLGLQVNYTFIDQKDLNDRTGLGSSQDDLGVGLVILDPNGNPLGEGSIGNRNTFRNFSDLPLPSYSEHTFNIVGMYEYEDISARLAYNWRSEYLITRRDSNEFAPIYSTDTGYLDASIYYTINDNLKVGIEGSNLLNTITTTQAQLNQAGDKTDSLNFVTDRRYALSLRATF